MFTRLLYANLTTTHKIMKSLMHEEISLYIMQNTALLHRLLPMAKQATY